MSAESTILASYVFCMGSQRKIGKSWKVKWLVETYQLILNCQKKDLTYFPVSGDHIQLLHDGNCHWLLAFISSGRVQVCDRLRTNLISISRKCLKFLFQPLAKNDKLEVTFLLLEKQNNGFNCGLFALGYASILLDGKSPVDARFVVTEIRNHFKKFSKDAHLYPFPTHVSSNKPKVCIF